MSRPWQTGLAVASCAWVAACPALLSAAETVTAPDRALLGHGRFVYLRHCLPCHGTRGDGAGDMAKGLTPPPRDFRAAVFKYRSTETGQLPTDGDLARTIRAGLSGTAMPAFAILQPGDIHAVVQYVKHFSKAFDDPRRQVKAPPVPSPPPWVADGLAPAEHVARGRLLYEVACAPCHGDRGKADGPSAAGLLDAWGHPTVPRNLQTDTLRSGDRPEDLYRLLLTGVGGTPMPAFADTTSDLDRWQLVVYLMSLRRQASPPDR